MTTYMIVQLYYISPYFVYCKVASSIQTLSQGSLEVQCYGPRPSKDGERSMAKATWEHLLWKHQLEVAKIAFQGIALGRPEEMPTVKHAETG